MRDCKDREEFLQILNANISTMRNVWKFMQLYGPIAEHYVYNEITRKVIIHIVYHYSSPSFPHPLPFLVPTYVAEAHAFTRQRERARLFAYKCKIPESHLLHSNTPGAPFASFFFSSRWIAFSSRVMCPQKGRYWSDRRMQTELRILLVRRKEKEYVANDASGTAYRFRTWCVGEKPVSPVYSKIWHA